MVELGVELLLLHIERCQLRWFIWLGCLLGGCPGSEPELSAGISGERVLLRRGMSGFPSWPHILTSDKQKMMDVRIDGLFPEEQLF